MRLIIHPEFFCVKNIWTASAGEDGIFRPDVRLLLICTKRKRELQKNWPSICIGSHVSNISADFFDLKSPYRQFILSHLQNEYSWIIDWYLTDFEKSTDHPEQLIFPVKLGFNVRSKSEVLIADRLYEEGILLHYEEKLFLSDHSCRPDFNLPITLYEKYKWEHFGAMDKSFYFNITRGKILAYLDNQMFPGINMLTTYETKQNPLTEEQVDYVITWLKRRYRLAFPDMPPDKSFNMYDLAAYVKIQRGQQ